MKKIIASSLLVMTLCLTLLPVNAYAQGVDAGIGYSRTKTHTSTTDYSQWHKTTDTHSTTRGAYGNVHIDGVNAQQVKNFYKNEIRPYSHAYLRNSNNNHNNNFSYNSSYNPPSFNPPKFNQPSFGSMGHFSAPSAPSFSF